jgi:hypothetical protein
MSAIYDFEMAVLLINISRPSSQIRSLSSIDNAQKPLMTAMRP